VLGPKFSKKDRAAIPLRREYSLNQVEYCRNFLFRRNFPIHKIFERSCELGLFRLTTDKIAQIFGVRKHKRIRGKLHSMLEKLDHGHHVLRIYCKSLLARMYEKLATFLRLEVCVNRLKDLGLNKGLENLNALRQKLVAVTDRLAAFQANLLNVHVEFPLFQRLALPIQAGRSKNPRHQNPGHPNDALDGSAAPRRFPARRLADGADPRIHARRLWPHRGTIHPDPTPL
jgi:hypothetical protein